MNQSKICTEFIGDIPSPHHHRLSYSDLLPTGTYSASQRFYQLTGCVLNICDMEHWTINGLFSGHSLSYILEQRKVQISQVNKLIEHIMYLFNENSGEIKLIYVWQLFNRIGFRFAPRESSYISSHKTTLCTQTNLSSRPEIKWIQINNNITTQKV